MFKVFVYVTEGTGGYRCFTLVRDANCFYIIHLVALLQEIFSSLLNTSIHRLHQFVGVVFYPTVGSPTAVSHLE